MTFWLNPLGLTPLKLFLAILFWALGVGAVGVLGWGISRVFARWRRRSVRRRLHPLLLHPEDSTIFLPVPHWPGDRGLLIDELLGIGRRERGSIGDRIRKELSQPFWLEPELLRMSSIQPRARAAAAQRLGEIQDPRALPFLTRACHDSFAVVRRAAARALFTLDPKAFATLLPRLFSDYSTWRVGEAEELMKTIGRSATPALQNVLDKSNESAKIRVIRLLGELADSRAIEMLEALKSSSNVRIRTLAGEILKTCYNPAQI